MKQVNLLSVFNAYKKLTDAVYGKYFNYLGFEIKVNELKCLESLLPNLLNDYYDILNLNNFYVGFKIPQISKEFDLLRVGTKYVINIELKSRNTGEKMLTQLERNKYYLNSLGLEVFNFTYVSSENTLYRLGDYSLLEPINFSILKKLLNEQEIGNIDNIGSLFNPSNYLVSPFNSTERFVNGEYFLTNQQEEFKKTILALFGSANESFVSICGKAGTGKTLLTYDIAKEFLNYGQKVLFIHCGKLNNGHQILSENYKWEILAAKYLKLERDYSEYSLIVIDEAQRIYPNQLEYVINKIKQAKLNCIFSFDNEQWLRRWEASNNISERIQNLTASTVCNLTDKIRTNKEIASFITAFFDRAAPIYTFNRENIELHFFSSHQAARVYLEYLKPFDWTVINYTPDSRITYPYEKFAIGGADNTHEILGQEYDKVVAVIDSHFYYNDKNQLSTKGYESRPYYHPSKMLFQIMTRTRNELCLIIIENQEVFNRCLSIINNK
ncbi:ATP-binding protein [Leeuwenhoekiella sp. LLG6367-2.1]|uniref:ATP-binding protein n=1 Tax=Leeuwenhoekiella sp. LLG6367-2.1 TaxID=3160833 RepID=UPI00386F8E99